ncbi:MAG: hypothetical protein ACRBBN_15770 [Methyloligellaceae bacterium]
MTENTYKQIRRTIETIEEKIPVATTPRASHTNRRPGWVTLAGLLITLVSALISIADYWDKQKKIALQDKLIGESQLKLPALPPSKLRRQKERAVSKKRSRRDKTHKRQRKRIRRKYRRRRYYERHYDPLFD